MERGSTSSTTTMITASSTCSRTDSERATSPHAAVIEAVRAHHAQLAEELRIHTAAVVTAARTGECGRERDVLHAWHCTELLPHAAAEEQALYSPALDLEATRLLISGMLAEHRFLESLIADLALASDPFQVATTAAAGQAVFTVHLAKENDLLLPALDQAGLDLHAILDGMHEILGHPHEHANHDNNEQGGPHAAAADDGCGRGADHDTGGAKHMPLQISMGAEVGVADGVPGSPPTSAKSGESDPALVGAVGLDDR